MSKLTREEVLKLARLSNLSLSDEEVTKFQEELGDILRYLDKLQSVDVSNTEPTHQVSGLQNSTRSDEVQVSPAMPDALLASTPKVDGRYIKVGRMI